MLSLWYWVAFRKPLSARLITLYLLYFFAKTIYLLLLLKSYCKPNINVHIVKLDLSSRLATIGFYSNE